ncbi:MAG: hypothetical protein FWH36_06945 [Lentimicrobiaceae bacterium]|nr:hypothetical protein [Lentimicrobiaceae bacterium]
MARYFAAPGATGNGLSWATVGDLQNLVSTILAAPSRGGDEIWCQQGTYSLATPLVINNNTEPLSIYGGFVGNELTLCDRNANIDSLGYQTDFFQNPSILEGTGRNRVIDMQQANVCRIDGFVIRKGNAMTAATGFDGGGMRVDTSSRNIWLENLVFMDNEAGNWGGGFYGIGPWNLMIKNSIFFRNHATNGGGLYITDGVNTQLVNLLFNDNYLRTGTNRNGAAIHLEANVSLKIINNTISGNNGNITGSSDVYINQSDVEIYNSILYLDTLAVGAATPSLNVTIEHCCLFNNPFAPLPLPPFNLPIGTNPDFVNQASLAASGDYHLRINPPYPNTSPCIDSGNTNLIFPFALTDLEGNPRFIDNGLNPFTFPTGVDMGALEVQ